MQTYLQKSKVKATHASSTQKWIYSRYHCRLNYVFPHDRWYGLPYNLSNSNLSNNLCIYFERAKYEYELWKMLDMKCIFFVWKSSGGSRNSPNHSDLCVDDVCQKTILFKKKIRQLVKFYDSVFSSHYKKPKSGSSSILEKKRKNVYIYTRIFVRFHSGSPNKWEHLCTPACKI